MDSVPRAGPASPETAPPSGAHPGFGSGAMLWLVRHAEVEASARSRAYGSDDVALSPEGLARSDELALSLARLAPARLLSSPLQRALYLARRAGAALGREPLVEPGLAEVDRGRWQSLEVAELHRRHAEEVAAFHADPWSFRGHGGESDSDVVARAWPILEREARAHPGAALVFVCHYNVIRCLVSVALGLPPARSFALRLDKARALLLEDRPTGFKLVALNLYDPGAFEARDEHLGAVR